MKNNIVSLHDIFILSMPIAETPYFALIKTIVPGGMRGHSRGTVDVAEPLVFRIWKGRRLCDFIGNDAMLPVVSDRTADLWTKCNFTGFRLYPCSIQDRAGNIMKERYHCIGITGRAGPRDRIAFEAYENATSILGPESRRVQSQSPAIPNSGIDKLRFDLDSWDGAEFFMLEDVDHILVTRKVIEAMDNERITGWMTMPILGVHPYRKVF